MTRQELLDEWLKRLEAPESVQFTGALADANGPGRCCLGHACEAYIALGGRLEVTRMSDAGLLETNKLGAVRAVLAYNGACMTLPETVADTLGLRDIAGEYSPTESQTESLANNNDSGLTLPEIARIIRARPRGLFKEEGEA